MNSSTNTCTTSSGGSEPISWLRLEAHALGEVGDPSERAKISEHLEQCAACAASLSVITSDNASRELATLSLPAREQVSESSSSKWQTMVDWLTGKNRWLLVGGGLLATTAAVLLMVRSAPVSQTPDLDAPHRASVGVKGGQEFVLSLIRDRAGVVSRAPKNFSSGDRFKVSLTCTEPGALELDLVVLQSGTLHRPMGTPTIHCGNNVLVPGAFSATGQDAFEVCVAPEPNRSSPLTLTDLKDAACVRLAAKTTK